MLTKINFYDNKKRDINSDRIQPVSELIYLGIFFVNGFFSKIRIFPEASPLLIQIVV